jgi:hypothetical protein
MLFNKHLKIQTSFISALTLCVLLAYATCAFSADFTVSSGATETTTQTLDGDDEGVIEAGGAIETTGNDEDGVDVTGDSNTLDNSGSISTTGGDANGIRLDASNSNTITSSGPITTMDGDANGFRLDTSNSNIITNSGPISTMGGSAKGFFLDGSDSNTLHSNGSITTKGGGAHGIFLENSNSNFVKSNSSISTEETGARGIFLDSASSFNTVKNNGSISTKETGADGIFFDAASNSNIVNNNGSISTMGDEADGISLDGASNFNIINNNGSISTMGEAHGIFLETSHSNTITSKGSITTMDGDANGIRLNGSDSNTINLSGSISTMDGDANGIRLDGSESNTINLSGLISTKGGDANGIRLNGSDSNTINLSGLISTMGGNAYGIRLSDSDSNTVNHRGSITTVGPDGHGFYLNGSSSGNIINNRGGIFVTGPGSLAIFDDSVGDNTLNIFPGSQIIGVIDFDQAGDVINIFGAGNGAGSSSTLMIAGTPTVNLMGANMVDLGSNVFAVVDPTGPSVNDAALGTMMSGIHNVLAGRGGQAPPAQVASTRIEPGMMPSADDSQIWFSGFGAHRERDTDGGVLAYDHDYYGGMGGYEMQLSRSSRIGFLAGYANTDLATDFQSLYTNAHSGFIGTYGQKKFSSFNLDGSLIAGYEQNDNNRIVVDNINGFELAEANYDSFFISPSATLSTQYNVSDKLVARSSITGLYSMGWYDSYTESGTTRSNLSIDDRLAHAFIAKAKIEMAYLFSKTCEVSFHIGGRYRYTINNDVNATLSGVSFQYATAGDDTNVEGLFGVNGRYALSDNINLNLHTQYSLNGIETNASGDVGVEILF